MWTPERRRRANYLNDYWNGLVRGDGTEQDIPGDQSDEELRETVDLVRLLYRRRRPDPAFASLLEKTLMNAFASTSATWITTPGATAPGEDRRAPRPAPVDYAGQGTERRVRWRPTATAIAAAALVLAILIGSAPSLWNALQPASPVPEVAISDVPIYRGSNLRTGENPGPGPATRPDLIWFFQTGATISSIPAIGNGLLFGGSDSGFMYALDARTGEMRWQFDAGARVFSPGYGDGAVVFVNQVGELYALEAETGELRWQSTGLGVSSSPAIADGLVYVGSNDGVVSALRTSDGTPVWTADLGASIFRSLTVTDDIVLVGTEDARLVALNRADGSVIWTYQTTYIQVQTPSARDGEVYGTSQDGGLGEVFSLDLATGSVRWVYALPQNQRAAAVLTDGSNVYFGDEFGVLHALSAEDGTGQWSVDTGSGAFIMGLPAIADGVIYVGDVAGAFHAYSTRTGALRWEIEIGESLSQAPIVSGGFVFVVTDAGSINAYGVGDGSPAIIYAPAPTSEATQESTPAAVIAETPVVEFLWQVTGSDAESFIDPAAVRVAPDGTFWVADGGQIFVFEGDGTFIETWGSLGSDPGQFRFTDPNATGAAIEFASDGSFWVADSLNARIQHFDKDRNLLEVWDTNAAGEAQFVIPIGLELLSDGTILVADPWRGDVQHFTPDGTFLGSYDAADQPSGTLNGPVSVKLDAQGRLIVVEQGGNRIRFFDLNFNELGVFEEPSDGIPGLLNPYGLAFDEAGNVYTTDIDHHRAIVYDSEGRYAFTWGVLGAGPGEFNRPGDVDIMADGTVLVLDWSNRRIQAFTETLATAMPTAAATPGAEYLWEVTGSAEEPFGDPCVAKFAPDGTLWVGDVGRFVIFDADGTYLETWGTYGTEPGQFKFSDPSSTACGIEFAPDGSFWVVDGLNFRIQHFDKDRNLLDVWGSSGNGDGQFYLALTAELLPDGTLLVADPARGDIQHFTGDGEFLGVYNASDQPSGALIGPASVKMDSQGRLVVVEIDGNRIRLFDLDFQELGVFESTAEGFTGLAYPFDVAFDADGFVYTADQDHHRIAVFDSEGRFVFTWGKLGQEPGAFNRSGGVDIGPDGVVIALDWAGRRVQAFHVTGLTAASDEPVSATPSP